MANFMIPRGLLGMLLSLWIGGMAPPRYQVVVIVGVVLVAIFGPGLLSRAIIDNSEC